MVLGVKEAVRNYWDNAPCGTGGIEQPEGTLEYYETVSRNRYRLDSFIPKFANFDRWSGLKVLEVGCGVGTDLAEFAKAGAIVTGIDISPRSVNKARERFELFGLRGAIIEGDAESIPYKDGVFDLAYNWGILHHTPNPEKAIREIYRVLKPWGMVKAMLYHRYSLVSLQARLRYGLLIGRPFRGLDDIMAHHMESPSTKVYTKKQVESMFSMFDGLIIDTVVTAYDIRYMRNRYLPLWCRRLVPKALGWNILVQGVKTD